MAKTVYIRLKSASISVGPFDIIDPYGNIIDSNVPTKSMIAGVTYSIDDAINILTIKSTGRCKKTISYNIGEIIPSEIAALQFVKTTTACLWRHLTNVEIYNTFYGVIEPYIIEYPFAYKFQDEILQNVKDYTKVYKYFTNGDGVFNYNDRTSVDNAWFNKAVLYNDQQSSGVLELVPKPLNNLKEYLKYPVYNTDSKIITYTKSDNFYQYNTFWSLIKNKSLPLFVTSCESLSIDKLVNQANMDYGKRSFKKEPLRAKDLKVRQILDNRSDVHLVSQFIVTPSQISYK